jgi:hypothetical protein
MWAKLADPSFLADVRPLLSADDAEVFDGNAERAAFVMVFTEFIKRVSGHAWAEMPPWPKIRHPRVGQGTTGGSQARRTDKQIDHPKAEVPKSSGQTI